jgi:FkbM family methyltransferase
MALARHGERMVEARRNGLLWRLDSESYLDRDIFVKGRFEGRTTRLVRRLVGEGMRVLDVGANFGYFTTLLAARVGPTGKVWAFEPTEHYGRRIGWHLEANALVDRVEVLPFGLSDRETRMEISIGDSSATLHPAPEHRSQRAEETKTERILLRRLDDVAGECGIDGADFVKADIDGHEPQFLEGARGFLERHRPLMVLEFNQANLVVAGRDAEGLRAQLEAMGYRLFSEKTRRPYRSTEEFAAECGRSDRSANVWAVHRSDGRSRLV